MRTSAQGLSTDLGGCVLCLRHVMRCVGCAGKAVMVKPAGLQVTVGVCTFRRPEALQQTLDSLARQSWPHAAFEIVVVDNDVECSARAQVERFAQTAGAPCVRYAVEPGRGVSHVRNQCVALARGEWLAFIDDDEVACSTMAAFPAQPTHRVTCRKLGPHPPGSVLKPSAKVLVKRGPAIFVRCATRVHPEGSQRLVDLCKPAVLTNAQPKIIVHGQAVVRVEEAMFLEN